MIVDSDLNKIIKRVLKETANGGANKNKTNSKFTYVPFTTFWNNFLKYILKELETEWWFNVKEGHSPTISDIESYKITNDIKSFLEKNYKRYMVKYGNITWKNYFNNWGVDASGKRTDVWETENQPGVDELGTEISKDFRREVIEPMLSDIENNIWDELVPWSIRSGIYTGIIKKDYLVDQNFIRFDGKITPNVLDGIVYFINRILLLGLWREGTSKLRSPNKDWDNYLLIPGGYLGQDDYVTQPENTLITYGDKEKIKKFIEKKFG